MGFMDRLKHGWNAFSGAKDDLPGTYSPEAMSYSSYMPGSSGRSYSSFVPDVNIIENIINRMSIDVASIEFIHARTDENGHYIEPMPTSLQECLSIEANIDQSSRVFIMDVVQTMLIEGVACVLPVDTTLNPKQTAGYDIKTMRVGRIVEWRPKHVKVEAYNENKGIREEVVMPKDSVAIIHNPLYDIMNKPNSTLQRLTRKLTQFDMIDTDIANKKLDMIIQVPYVVKSEARKKQAERKREDVEFQLRSSDYGVAWIDATDKVTQLNRPIENNMLPHVQYLTEELYSYLGLTKALLEGSATEQEFLNYYSRTIEPIADTITEEFSRKFLTKTARSQLQSVLYLRKPFKLVPMKDLSDVINSLTRNEVVSSNEARAMIGLKPSSEPGADELRNANMPRDKTDYGDSPTEPSEDVADDSYEE